MTRRAALLLALAAVLPSAGCGQDKASLKQFVAKVKARPADPIDPIPEMRSYTPYAYNVGERRPPFTPTTGSRRAPVSSNQLKPNPGRDPDPLEAFPLDALRMVGTITRGGVTYALIEAPDNVVHRVQPGDHMGQNYGRVQGINNNGIRLIEIVPNGTGGYVKQPTAMAPAQ